MKHFLRISILLWAGVFPAIARDRAEMESVKAASDLALNTDPKAAFWQSARAIYAVKDKNGRPLPRYRTEIRSRWTGANIYFLFICPYERLNLKPSPNTAVETQALWNWDVAEIFIGSDFHNIQRYKEFEMSPQGEWMDLDIDLTKPHHEEGWTWNSGFQVAAQIDSKTKIWYGVMRIPFAAIAEHPPIAGDKFRVNLYRSQGPESDLRQIMWQPTLSESFHVPEHFGILKLVE